MPRRAPSTDSATRSRRRRALFASSVTGAKWVQAEAKRRASCSMGGGMTPEEGGQRT
jgi:hypothetical protein